MKEILTTIYSQPSIEPLKELVSNFLTTFGIYDISIDDMFYYNIFCSASTYANYNWEYLIQNSVDFDIPFNLYAPCSTSDERIDYVETIIKDVLLGNIKKPEWMIYIEMESHCDNSLCEQQPSNFLRLLPKDEKYEVIGKSLIEFLYSPNRTSVVY